MTQPDFGSTAIASLRTEGASIVTSQPCARTSERFFTRKESQRRGSDCTALVAALAGSRHSATTYWRERFAMSCLGLSKETAYE